jgi:hypothetical protein
MINMQNEGKNNGPDKDSKKTSDNQILFDVLKIAKQKYEKTVVSDDKDQAEEILKQLN